MKLLENKVAVITGGTRGIGKAIALNFLEQGAKVIICGSREETVSKAIQELREKNSDYVVDGKWPKLTDYLDVERNLQQIADKYGKIDILVNNAGVSDKESIFDYDPIRFAEVMDINVNAVFYGCKAVAPIMRKNGGGVIINTSSMVSKYGQPKGVAYPASKFAVNGLTVSLARELAEFNIRVNAVAPGVTDTDMVANLPEAMREGISKTIPLGRIGTPDDVARAFVYLASDMASYVTGEILQVDGACRS